MASGGPYQWGVGAVGVIAVSVAPRVDKVVSAINAVTAGELQQLAKEMLVGDRLRLAVVGPVPQDEPLEELLKL